MGDDNILHNTAKAVEYAAKGYVEHGRKNLEKFANNPVGYVADEGTRVPRILGEAYLKGVSDVSDGLKNAITPLVTPSLPKPNKDHCR
jgi:hypothetical protein